MKVALIIFYSILSIGSVFLVVAIFCIIKHPRMLGLEYFIGAICKKKSRCRNSLWHILNTGVI